jgi:hypothetical protein
MAIHSIRDTGGKPSGWELKLFANISGSEDFLMQLAMEMPELVDASMIYGQQRDALKEAILTISVEGLMPAFEHLKKIRNARGQEMPELNRKQMYEDFSRVLWHAYKDLGQKAATMMEPEFGFLYQKDATFDSGLAAWINKRPQMAPVSVYLRNQRTRWQNPLSNFRNYLEHKDGRDPSVFAGRYDPEHAEALFGAVWRTIADILAMLVSLHLPPGTSLVEIPVEQRDAVRRRRFHFAVRGISSAPVVQTAKDTD